MVLSNSFGQGEGTAVDVIGASVGAEIRNNILGAPVGISVSDNSQTDLVSDYNLFYCGGAVGSWQSANRTSRSRS